MGYNSPAAFNPGGRKSSENDYKTPAKCRTVFDTPNPGLSGASTDPFVNYESYANQDGSPVPGAGMTGGAGNDDQGFDFAAYARHLAASGIKADAESNQGSSAAANSVGDVVHNFSSHNPSLPTAGSTGPVAGPSSSTSPNVALDSLEELDIAAPSSSNPAPSAGDATDDQDAQFDNFFAIPPGDDSGSQ